METEGKKGNRGGSRPGTGGARPGAGRPKKVGYKNIHVVINEQNISKLDAIAAATGKSRGDIIDQLIQDMDADTQHAQ